MRFRGDKKFLWIGGWILSGLFLVAFNGYELYAFLKPISTETPIEIPRLNDKLRKLKALDSKDNNLSQISLDFQKIHYNISQKPIEKDLPAPVVKRSFEPDLRQEIWPEVRGMLLSLDSDGDLKLMAMIGPKIVNQGDQIDGYRVKEISREGVVLERGGLSRFIGFPHIPFSLNKE